MLPSDVRRLELKTTARYTSNLLESRPQMDLECLPLSNTYTYSDTCALYDMYITDIIHHIHIHNDKHRHVIYIIQHGHYIKHIHYIHYTYYMHDTYTYTL